MNWKEDLIKAIKDKEFVRYKVDDEMHFDHGEALAVLLLKGVVFLNSHHWEDTWPDEAKESVGVFVNCSDIFAWAFAEGEDLPFDKIQELYEYWEKDEIHGPAVWCILRRGELPQKPVYDAIQRRDIWDLDKLEEEYSLIKNRYDKHFRKEKL